MTTPPYGPGETAVVYQAVHAIAEISRLAPIDVSVHHGHVDITTIGGPGVVKAWLTALAPARVQQTIGGYVSHAGYGVEDLLKTPEVTVHVRPSKAGV